MNSLVLLRQHAGDLKLDPEIECVFLAGFLESSGALKVTLKEFDEAATAFKTATKTDPAIWVKFLGQLVDERNSEPAWLGYLLQTLKEYRDATRDLRTATPPTVGGTINVCLPVRAEEWSFMLEALKVRRSLPNVPLGATLGRWESAAEELLVRVGLANAEGGPALFAELVRKDGRIIAWAQPSYDAVMPFVFNINGRTISAQLVGLAG